MPDHFSPIFPPSLPNVSHEHAQRAESLLAEDVAEALRLDRARQSVASASGAMMLCEQLGLDTSTSDMFTRAVIARGDQLSVEYQAYFARLLGTSALVLSSQDRRPSLFQQEDTTSDLTSTDIPEDLVMASTSMDDTGEVSLYPDSAPMVLQSGDASTFTTPDIKRAEGSFPDNLVLYKYEKPPTAQRKLVAKGLYGPHASVRAVDGISAPEIAATTWLLRQEVRNLPFERSRKGRQEELVTLLDRLTGLYEPPLPLEDIGRREGKTVAALLQRWHDLQRRIHEHVQERGEELIASARDAVKEGKVTFAIDPEIRVASPDSVPEYDEHVRPQPLNNPGTHAPIEGQAPSDTVPESMRHFLGLIYPDTARAKLDTLKPYQARLLVEELLTRYRELQSTGLKPDQQVARAHMVELHTGLRDEPVTIEYIAANAGLSVEAARNTIHNVINKIGRELLPPELMQILIDVRSRAVPTNTTP